MKRSILTWIIVAVAVLAIVDQAQAAAWSAPDTVKAIAVADAHWPASPCHGREVIQWTDEATLIQTWGKPIYPVTYAQAFDASCFVQVAWATTIKYHPSPDYLCALLEHEFGHLAGLGHSTDPHDVMYSDPIDFPWVPHDCAKAFPARSMCKYTHTTRAVYARLLTLDVCEGRPFGGIR